MAVLAVDPSSTRTGGSILGDKTRMPRLAADPNAFVRPSPAVRHARRRRREDARGDAAVRGGGLRRVLVETVGIGQSETAVADMTDFFLVLMLPGAGDELQGLKKGVVELADMIAVNKADGDNVARANGRGRRISRRAAYHQRALRAVDAAGHHLFGPDRRRHRGAVGPRSPTIASA